VRTLSVSRLGLVPYLDALAWQKTLVEERRAGTIGDTLVLLEHPPVITLGARSRGLMTHVVAPAEVLAREGIAVPLGAGSFVLIKTSSPARHSGPPTRAVGKARRTASIA